MDILILCLYLNMVILPVNLIGIRKVKAYCEKNKSRKKILYVSVLALLFNLLALLSSIFCILLTM